MNHDDRNQRPPHTSWWELLPYEVRFAIIAFCGLLLSFAVLLLDIGATRVTNSLAEFRSGRESVRPADIKYWSDDLGPQRERGKAGLICSIFGSLLRRPQRCE